MSTMHRRRGKQSNLPALRRELPSRKDRALQQHIVALKDGRKRFSEIDKWLRRALELPHSKTRSFAAKALHAIVPQRMYGVIPNWAVELVAEEEDVLEFLGRLMRENIDNVQEALCEIAEEAAEKKQQLEGLKEDILTAEEERWDAKHLQEYMAEHANIQVYEQVARLLDEEFNIISAEEREAHKKELLGDLKRTADLGETLMGTMGEVCVAGLSVFRRASSQYYQYVSAYRPIAVVRDSARTMLEINTSIHAGREALVVTFEESLRAIETAVDAAENMARYSIASSEFQGLLEHGRERLKARRKLLPQPKEPAEFPALTVGTIAPDEQENG